MNYFLNISSSIIYCLILSNLILSYLTKLVTLHQLYIDREVEMRIRNLSGQLIMACADGKNSGDGNGAVGKKKHGDTKQYNRYVREI